MSGLSAASWAKPPNGIFKVNVDAHIVAGNYVRLGVVVCDAEGVVRMMATKRFEGDNDPTMDKCVGYRLLIARGAGYDKIWLQCDALAMVQAVHKEDVGFSPIGCFIMMLNSC